MIRSQGLENWGTGNSFGYFTFLVGKKSLVGKNLVSCKFHHVAGCEYGGLAG